ncbi:diguanylate cyclase domain protein [Clostridiales bacterium oral taxon 876 str. F0540]|nr:diguanylate cyclase domain protein [Clostridiales bacterium oral taxon 876 str. F0540]
MDITNLIEKIDKLNNNAEEVIRITPAKSIELSNEAYELSKQAGYKVGTVKSLLTLGKALYIVGNFEKAISMLIDALGIARNENFKESQADILNILGNVNLALVNYNLALEYYMKSLDIIRAIDYKKTQSGVLNNIGEIYKDLKNYEVALNYYTESLEICELADNKNVACIVLQNIGEVHYHLKNFDMAEKYTEKSLKLSRKVNDRMIEAACLHQLGKIAFKQDNLDKALNLFLKSLEISKETKERYFIISVMIDIHKLLIKINKNEEAVEYLESALTLAHEINSKEMIMKVYSYLAELHEKIGEFDKALSYYKKFHDVEISGMNEEIAHKLKNITIQFKMEQSEQEKEIYRLKNVELKEKTEALEKKTSELMESYNNMKTISEIGQSITSTLDFEKILNLVYKSINNLMQAYAFGIALYDKDTGDIEYSLFIENSIRYPVAISNINKSTWASWCILNRKEVLINDVEKEYKNYIKDRINTHGTKAGSLIYCPLIFEDNVLGVITVQSPAKHAYSQYNFDTVKALASYIAIAIRNAQKSSDLEKLNKKLLSLSNLDGLTEIPNRRYFEDEIDSLWKETKASKQSLSLMLIDVDNFKEYNDNYGHLAGDYCLQMIAKTLQSVVKDSSSFVARYGGDEFVAVFPNTSSESVFAVAETMKRYINDLNIVHEFSKVSNRITLTFGIASVIPDENLSISSLKYFADKALYIAKQNGRNTIAVY